MSNLTFDQLSVANRTRVARWHGDFQGGAWTGADWSNAMCGEAGETANVVKKIRRLETGSDRGPDDPPLPELLTMLGNELADTVTYADLLGQYYDLDLGRCVARKFNAVSIRQGFPDRLPAG
jgi:NTP pyrophosphatase (non-canonical NTP hydrolase)